MHRTGNRAFAPKLSDIPYVHENDIIIVKMGMGLIDGPRFNECLGFCTQLLDTLGDHMTLLLLSFNFPDLKTA